MTPFIKDALPFWKDGGNNKGVVTMGEHIEKGETGKKDVGAQGQ